MERDAKGRWLPRKREGHGRARPGRASPKEVRLSGQARPAVREASGRAFGRGKRDVFLLELGATCNVAVAARKAGVGKATVYKHRRADAPFRAAWARALGEGYARLEVELLERALNGTTKTVTKAEGRTERTHELPNALALQLLRMHREDVRGADEMDGPEDDIQEARDRLTRKLDALRRRLDVEAGREPEPPR